MNLRVFEKPDLPEDKIIAGAREAYGVAIRQLEFLPLGHDYSAWVYRAEAADGAAFFLKLRTGPVSLPSVIVPRALLDAGISGVVAPLPVVSGGQPWGTVDDYTVLLYPFVAGGNAPSVGFTDPRWIEYGALLRRIHATTLPDAVLGQVPRETFVSAWCNGTRAFLGTVELLEPADRRGRELVGIWREKRDEIARLIARTDELGRALRARPRQLVLCHTDPHPYNLLVDGEGRLRLVDWDAPLLAPKERDLHFVIGSIFVPERHAEELILGGYGPTEIDWRALTYYRNEWVCGDLIAYAETVLATGDVGDLAKDDGVRSTRVMFEPGGSVASTYELEHRAKEAARS